VTELFTSPRYFQVWSYSVTKTRLLLRSTLEGGERSRIDLYFGGVSRMLLRPAYDGLTLVEAGAAERETFRDHYGEITPDAEVFLLEPGLASFVVAGVAQWHEDTGTSRDPSYFGL
jgi:hypothetical protein